MERPVASLCALFGEEGMIRKEGALPSYGQRGIKIPIQRHHKMERTKPAAAPVSVRNAPSQAPYHSAAFAVDFPKKTPPLWRDAP